MIDKLLWANLGGLVGFLAMLSLVMLLGECPVPRAENVPVVIHNPPVREGMWVRLKTTGYHESVAGGVAKKWIDGKTATMTRSRRGVCAADWKVFPTKLNFVVPGYGDCRVEDSGNKVKGYHLDLYFDTAKEAKAWGVRTQSVFLYYPQP